MKIIIAVELILMELRFINPSMFPNMKAVPKLHNPPKR